MANYQAEVANNNAIVARQKATYATEAGETQAQAESLKERARFASVKAAEASSNVDVNSGTALDLQQTQRELGELDTQTRMSNAALNAYGYRSDASYFEAQSNLYSAAATGDIAGGFLSGAGSLLSNAKSLSGIFSSAQSGPDLDSPDIVSAFG